MQALQDLRPSMLGTFANPCLAVKAAECSTLLRFCRDAMFRHADKLGTQGKYLLEVGNALAGVQDLMVSSPTALDDMTLQRLVDFARRACSLREAAGVAFLPKWHLFLHICQRARFAGNPAWYNTFVDEGHNGRLAKLAAKCHRTTWFHRVLAAFRFVESRAVRRRIV